MASGQEVDWEREREQLMRGRMAWKEQANAERQARLDAVSELESKLKSGEEVHAAALAEAAKEKRGAEAEVERLRRELDTKRAFEAQQEQLLPEVLEKVADLQARTQTAEEEAASLRKELEESRATASPAVAAAADRVSELESQLKRVEGAYAERAYNATPKQEREAANSGRDEAANELESLRATCQRQAADIALSQANFAVELAQANALLDDARSQLVASQSQLRSQSIEHSAALAEKDEATKQLIKENADEIIRARAEARAAAKRELAEVMQQVQERIAAVDLALST
jgi:hypothetical protein